MANNKWILRIAAIVILVMFFLPFLFLPGGLLSHFKFKLAYFRVVRRYACVFIQKL